MTSSILIELEGGYRSEVIDLEAPKGLMAVVLTESGKEAYPLLCFVVEFYVLCPLVFVFWGSGLSK